MTEQQTVEGTPATPAPAGEQPAEGSQETPPTARSAAEVEAEYKARLSGKDKAHAAEVAALRSQLESEQGHSQTATQQQEAAGDEVTALKRQLAEAQKTNQTQQQGYQRELRSTKYPFAAEALDPNTLATMDEAKLAGLDARLKPSAPAVPVDPNTPQGGAPAPKPTNEMSSKELKAELARQGAGFAEELRNR